MSLSIKRYASAGFISRLTPKNVSNKILKSAQAGAKNELQVFAQVEIPASIHTSQDLAINLWRFLRPRSKSMPVVVSPSGFPFTSWRVWSNISLSECEIGGLFHSCPQQRDQGWFQDQKS